MGATNNSTQGDDKPYTLPRAVTLAQRCESRAWADDIDDRDRLLLEQASDCIRSLMARCVGLAAAAERREARRSRR